MDLRGALHDLRGDLASGRRGYRLRLPSGFRDDRMHGIVRNDLWDDPTVGA